MSAVQSRDQSGFKAGGSVGNGLGAILCLWAEGWQDNHSVNQLDPSF